MGVHKLIIYNKGKYNLQNFLRINFGKKKYYSKNLEKLSIHISTFKKACDEWGRRTLHQRWGNSKYFTCWIVFTHGVFRSAQFYLANPSILHNKAKIIKENAHGKSNADHLSCCGRTAHQKFVLLHLVNIRKGSWKSTSNVICNWTIFPLILLDSAGDLTRLLAAPISRIKNSERSTHLRNERLVSYHPLWKGTRCVSLSYITLHLTSSLAFLLGRAAWLICDKWVTETSLTMLYYQLCYVNLLVETTQALKECKVSSVCLSLCSAWRQLAIPPWGFRPDSSFRLCPWRKTNHFPGVLLSCSLRHHAGQVLIHSSSLG